MGASVGHESPSLTISELHLPAHPSKLDTARRYAHQAAAAFGLDVDSCHEFVFAVNEAVTNAIRHGTPDEQGQIHLSVLVDGDRLTLSVCNHGTFVASDMRHTTLSECGRGFALMVRLMDAVQLCVTPGSTTVRLSKARA
jgi:anti-sigma regulatory factor (Ser/Thr protein kinase)